MGLFTSSRTSRSQRKAQAKAIKAREKLSARLSARVLRKDLRARLRQERTLAKKARRSEQKAALLAAKTAKETNRVALKVAKAEVAKAKAQAEAAAAGTSITPKKVKRFLSLARLAAPVVVPLAYRASTVIREQLTEYRANKMGVPLAELNKFSGHGAALSARIAGARRSLQTLAATRDNTAETKRFVATMNERLTDLAAAVSAAEHMPAARRRAAHQAISRELAGIDADLLARLGVRP
ncbi:DUF6474 family protein [Williamsia sp. CHRR-6]|uniref:DUF6474 family protein n=1 Tax=Williamsia sp. CHRR-6 TaxID=2835871 RepID=UPI001BD9E337|nr:DUF6474 family protein [Williamsia sp. CHRR-6]MBT0567646.1 hypothetical protein [Williamsia sp. CHRR-6]